MAAVEPQEQNDRDIREAMRAAGLLRDGTGYPYPPEAIALLRGNINVLTKMIPDAEIVAVWCLVFELAKAPADPAWRSWIATNGSTAA